MIGTEGVVYAFTGVLEEISLGKQTGSISVQWFLSGHFQFGRRTERSVEVKEEIMWINISQI